MCDDTSAATGCKDVAESLRQVRSINFVQITIGIDPLDKRSLLEGLLTTALVCRKFQERTALGEHGFNRYVPM